MAREVEMDPKAMAGKISVDQAMQLMRQEWWTGMSAKAVATLQLSQPLFCMPAAACRNAVSQLLGRSVSDVEIFTRQDELLAEINATA